MVSDKNKEERERTKVPTIRADVTVAHNYSSQSLNSTELAKEKLRQMLAEVRVIRMSRNEDYFSYTVHVPYYDYFKVSVKVSDFCVISGCNFTVIKKA